MKEFFKWLGVNEKVAKVGIWTLIILVTLIIFNTAFDSLGLPHYKITVDNLVKIDAGKIVDYLIAWIITILNFYTMIFLVFRVKEFKKIFPYSILYLILNILVTFMKNYALLQVFIILFFLGFCYLYSDKKWKYVFYGILSYITGVFVQFIWFTYKASSIDINSLNNASKTILTIDFFIIMIVIILAKEIYLKQRRDKVCGAVQDVCYGLENSKKKDNSLKN